MIATAADGSGPPSGARVATFGWSGAWGEQRAVDTGELAILPNGVEFGSAAALPVAGVTALRAVRRLGSVVGRTVLSVGMASLQPTTIDFDQLRNRAGRARIEGFTVGPRFGSDLAYLVSLLEAGALEAEIGWRGSWDGVDETAGALLGLRVRGNAVLEVSP